MSSSGRFMESVRANFNVIRAEDVGHNLQKLAKVGLFLQSDNKNKEFLLIKKFKKEKKHF